MSQDPPPRRRGRNPLPAGVPVTSRRAGDARVVGRLDRPLGQFILNEKLSEPGAIAANEAIEIVVEDWARQVNARKVSQAVISNYETDARSLAKFATAQGRPDLRDIDASLILSWMHAPRADGQPVAPNTRLRRRSAARALFTTAQCLGLHDLNPAASVEEFRRKTRYVGAFTDGQIQQLKDVAPYRLGETKAPVILALALLGAANAEIAETRVSDIDLEGERVWLHDGGIRWSPRFVPIDDAWAHEALRTRIEALRCSTDPATLDSCRIAYDGVSKEANKRSAATAMTLMKLMQTARVHTPGKTRAESIREWLAARIFDKTGRVEAVAARLGMRSLDAAAHIVGYDWVAAYELGCDEPEDGATS